jgi:hypothetical protein
LFVVKNSCAHVRFKMASGSMNSYISQVRNAQGVPKAWISWRLGGDRCDYADEMPMVRKMFADELAQHGLTPRMDRAYAQKLADLPPLAKST